MKKIILALLAVAIANAAMAQFKKPKRVNDNPLKGTQWWVGIGGGINLSQVDVGNVYHVLIPTQINAESPEKEYESYQSLGFQFDLAVSYHLGAVSFILQPSYVQYSFDYHTRFVWENAENQAQRVELNNLHHQNLNYLNVPLKVRYEIHKGKVIPFIQAGGFFGFLIGADKVIETSGIDNASGSDNILPVAEHANKITGLLNEHNYGLMAGLGAILPIGDGRFSLEINYQHSLPNIVQPGKRYRVDKFVTGAYDVLDDWSLRNLLVNANFSIPLKFVTSKDFVPVNR